MHPGRDTPTHSFEIFEKEYSTLFTKIFTDSPRRTQYIYAKVKISAATAAVSSAHARPSPSEHIPAVRMRQWQAVPRAATRRLCRKGREPYLPMMNLYCDPVTLLFIDACYSLLSRTFMLYVFKIEICRYLITGNNPGVNLGHRALKIPPSL